MKPWIADVIGKPWKAGARGPDEFDCWGLVWYVYAKRLGVTLPMFEGHSVEAQAVSRALAANLTTTGAWRAIDRPEELCGVAMGRNRIIHHVGLYTEADGGLVVHASDGARVVGQTLSTLRTQAFNRILFYKYDYSRAPIQPL